MQTLWSNAAIFVLPSSHESLSITLLEAMSYHFPVLVSNIFSNKEIELSKDCYFRMGDPLALSGKLKRRLIEGTKEGYGRMEKYN